MKFAATINKNHHTKQNKKGKIRIIGGRWKGKKINITQHHSLRPTTNQIRETLFNWLIPVINESKCLDCFAGSGALGLEALSRNANTVTFLEKNKKISNKLYQTIQLLNAQKQATIIHTNSNTWLANPTNKKNQYNIIFLDPPFEKWCYILSTIQLLEKFQYLTKNAWIYIENSKINNNNIIKIIPKHWQLHKKKLLEKSHTKFILD
ncbi:16S rRNA (guanine(966)-N(2))-methyltransferase RsmD [Blochmannia endosymbiont of Polyrhachis (Hedomyrma) turneri]|uniref:16S rRNA (guanine(966)-N(2))-methyltransferase RsmD n=1 Tax=Blochmannia endosymbiont of Polyrhachis (Hedomyrma) turneri TaxID=1505596 RepID=UPI00061A5EE9|nr:16S rRNA (guanine(966)-N(2))-methyltransferase RsmD [Blochmannia endosymbiont of Polyrhachis (Hedomyrma) turneri]AKC60183.1 Ribosomal RNA small subunit methyltransferase D [Blochmannia endosymbiont of Polyrhachis (Hedomyrma) turneri]